MAAATMVGRLLDRYALGMDEIELRDARCVQLEVPAGGRRRRPVDGCVPAIARFCDCKVWLAAARPEEDARYVFFGFETDVALAGYLFSVCDRAVNAALAAFRAQSGLAGVELRRACTNFQHGMAARIGERLERITAERQAGMAARPATGTALVLVKHRTVEAAFREAQIRLASGGRAAPRPTDGAYRSGRAAAEGVNLSRPLQGSPATRLR